MPTIQDQSAGPRGSVAVKSLNEHDSKELLKTYGVPVVTERLVKDAREAVAAAQELGYPVVLKGHGAKLTHKSELGLVRLNLFDSTAVSEAVGHIRTRAGKDLEGFLVQPQIDGQRELTAGLFHDPQFGPVIMFGLGGVLAEALHDVVFRLAPLNETDADQMMTEISAVGLLDEFRGEKAVDRTRLRNILLGLSRIAENLPRIREVDINPLRIDPRGRPVAVDALVIESAAADAPVEQRHPPVNPTHIRALFYPRSVAFVGASAAIGKWGNMLMTNTITGGYAGKVYLVNPKGGEIAGRRVYPSVTEIPDPVDLAVVTIPAAKVIELIPHLAQKNIRNLLLISSGFGEIGADGKRLERQLVAEARKAGVLLLGPNTMGICNPHIRFFCTGSPVAPLAGSTAVVAQSGNMGLQLLAFAENQGIGIRGFCGSGNEAMITVEDFLDGFEIDELTRTVMLYVESLKDGRRFFESARRLGAKKPIVLLKGGRSDVGRRAAASHTGAMAADAAVFDAMCRQAGIVKVDRPTDLLDLAAAFSSLPAPKGNRAGIMTLGGGWGVVTADLCADYSIEVPPLPDRIIAEIDSLLPHYWSRANPIDLVGESDPSLLLTIMETLMKWDGCDGVISLGVMGWRFFIERFAAGARQLDSGISPELLDAMMRLRNDFETEFTTRAIELMAMYDKPIYGVSLLPDENQKTVYRREGHAFKAVFFQTPEQAVKAFAGMVRYHRYRSRSPENGR